MKARTASFEFGSVTNELENSLFKWVIDTEKQIAISHLMSFLV